MKKSHSFQFPLFPTEPRTLAQACTEYTAVGGPGDTVNLAESRRRWIVYSLQLACVRFVLWPQLPQAQGQMEGQAHIGLIELQSG